MGKNVTQEANRLTVAEMSPRPSVEDIVSETFDNVYVTLIVPCYRSLMP